MIQVNAVTRNYGTFKAVDRVSFTIQRGEIVGLLGHNGAGKTTIMKMLTGYLEPSSGEIELAGQKRNADPANARRLIGYLPENCPLYREMSAIDTLEYRAALYPLTAQQRRTAIRDALTRTGLQARALDPIATLSRGLRQRVGVAQAILHRPQILILDEPTSGLDPLQIEQMRNLIRDLASEATIILSTHILQEVQATCDRVIILRQGRKVLDDRLESLQTGAALQLRSDISPDQLTQLRNELPEIEGYQQLPSASPGHHYTLQLTCDSDHAAPRIAQRIIEQGHRLYALTPESRNLETIFRDSANAAPAER